MGPMELYQSLRKKEAELRVKEGNGLLAFEDGRVVEGKELR